MTRKTSNRRLRKQVHTPKSRKMKGSIWTAMAIAACAIAGMEIPQCTSASKAQAEAALKNHYPGLTMVNGAPAANTEKNYEGFDLSFNPTNGTPDWVAWELLGSETDGPVSRSNKFHADSSVAGSPDPADYTRSGYDRGHLCPAADQKWSSQAMSDCFYMTNMAPQKHELNAGAWKTLEEKERLWAVRDSALVIVAGPIYSDCDNERIGRNGVRVPSAFYKCIIAPYLLQPRGIAFIYPNMKCTGDMRNYAVSIDEVERQTGLDFFYNLPDDLEQDLESQNSFRAWNLR